MLIIKGATYGETYVDPYPAKDDYNVIVFKILTYLYALLKGKEIFDQANYKASESPVLLLCPKGEYSESKHMRNRA
ncbi:MAG: hypothetical protein IJ591_02410 [Lachnospiraceae bacterium]|nr:hypothetical protein [Lachnospiraceae bacterium]